MTNAGNLAHEHDGALLRSYASNMHGRPSSNFMNRVAQTYYIDMLELVKLVTPVCDDGRILPAGSVGTVVYKYVGTYDYEVEFSQPFQSVVYVEGRRIAPVRD